MRKEFRNKLLTILIHLDWTAQTWKNVICKCSARVRPKSDPCKRTLHHAIPYHTPNNIKSYNGRSYTHIRYGMEGENYHSHWNTTILTDIITTAKVHLKTARAGDAVKHSNQDYHKIASNICMQKTLNTTTCKQGKNLSNEMDESLSHIVNPDTCSGNYFNLVLTITEVLFESIWRILQNVIGQILPRLIKMHGAEFTNSTIPL